MTSIKETTEYQLFKKCKLNRELDESLVKIFEFNLAKCNLLKYRPILVNDCFEVIDGQHRLEACKRLSLPVHYQVKCDMSENDLIMLNTVGKAWTYNDFMNFYIAKGKPEYINIKAIMEEFKIPIWHILLFTGKRHSNVGEQFKSGEIKMLGKDKIRELINIFVEIKEFLKVKMVSQDRRYLMNKTFFRAIISFLTHPGVDKDVFIHKLEIKLGLLRSCTNAKEYLQIFQHIYNYKNSNPVNLMSEL